MSKDKGGLLSKVVKFVRYPTTQWSELDNPDSVQEEERNKQALKEVLERKKRNDFVRGRELDMLRKIRRRELLGAPESGVRPSFFQSSLMSTPDGRAKTLKKIDEIEAQMSMQWWKTKRGESVLSESQQSRLGPSSGQGSSSARPPLGAQASAFAAVASSAAPVVAAPVVAAPDDAAHPISQQDGVPNSQNFSASKSLAIEVGEIAHDPELEEASIRFASGDDAGAEGGLRAVLGEGGSHVQNPDAWLALFDLYRATGQQEPFESAAMEFVTRFQRSAPQWFSMLEHVEPVAAAAPVGAQLPHWTCPPSLGTQSLAALNAALGRARGAWRIDWHKLVGVGDAAVVVALAQIFESWAAQPVQLSFLGDAQVDRLLEDQTVVGDPSISTDWWRLRLAWLRVMGREADFEEVAMNYCITYEVSPPSWDAPRCTHLSPEAGALDGEGAPEVAAPASAAGPGASGRLALSGVIVGDVAAQLAAFDGSDAAGKATVEISCARLARVDFAAAGTLLNWVSARQAQGRRVEFKDAHRLVAAFFHVIGIGEQARVLVRKD